MILALAMLATLSLEPTIKQFTDEEMAIFASNRMLMLEAKDPKKYKTVSVIQVLLDNLEKEDVDVSDSTER